MSIPQSISSVSGGMSHEVAGDKLLISAPFQRDCPTAVTTTGLGKAGD